MNKQEIIDRINYFYPSSDKNKISSATDCYETVEFKRLQKLIENKYSENEMYLDVPKWFMLKKWPKPLFTRQANGYHPTTPYFSIWIHDMVKGEHYTISSSYIIPCFLIYKWVNKNIPKEGVDYIGRSFDRNEYFNNLTFEQYNPDMIVGIPINEVECIYQKYLNTKLFYNIDTLEDVVPNIYFEGRLNGDFLIRDIFDGVSEHKINKPYLDELGSGFI